MFCMVHLSVVISSYSAEIINWEFLKYEKYERELNMSGIKYPVDTKYIGKSEHQNKISVNVYECEDTKSSRYVLPPWSLHNITSIYYMSLLMKNLITYCRKTWTDWYRDYIIITKVTNISVNIVWMAAPVKRYWKTIWKDASYTGHKVKFTTFTFCHLCGFQKRFT